MELIARAWMDREGSPAARAARLARRVPLLLGVALTRPAHWGDWAQGRCAPPARRAGRERRGRRRHTVVVTRF